jgi:YVTN family beta-propeller protein
MVRTTRHLPWLLAPALAALSGAPAVPSGAEPPVVARPVAAAIVEPHRSPADVVLTPDGRSAISANHTAHTASLIDLAAGKVVAEVAVGKAPWAAAITADGKLAAVANLRGDSVTLLAVDSVKPAIAPLVEIPVGHEPRGVAFNDSGRELFVALGGADQIAVIDVEGRKVARRFGSGGREPRGLALSPDGRTLWVVNSRSAEAVHIDRVHGTVYRTVKMHDAGNINRAAIAADGAIIAPHMVRRSLPVSRGNIAEGWVIDNRLTRITPEPDRGVEQAALDERGDACADLFAVVFSPDRKHMIVTAAGTHELLVFHAGKIPWTVADPGDLIDTELLGGPHKMRRIPLGGRPMGAAISPDSRTAVAANYLSDSIQVVDLAAGKVERTIRLGGPQQPSPARQGEAIFYDAKRSHAGWFSCNTCHVEGHTNGMLWDTLNDNTYGNPKLTLSLRGVAKTGPWTWHGFQNDLADAARKSLITTMSGDEPDDADVAAVVEFFRTLDHPRNPNRGPNGKLSSAAKRGEAVFFGKANCSECHNGPQYTSSKLFNVKTALESGRHALFSPPTLRGLHARGPFLHDGRAETLEDVVRKHHTPTMVGGQEITEAERRDLIEFLKAL